MLEKDQKHYEYIAQKNRKQLMKLKCFSKTAASKKNPFTTEYMFRIDILSIIFKINRNYLKYYPQ
jgi:hypothetical protein